MSSRLNNPKYLKRYYPLNNHLDDLYSNNKLSAVTEAKYGTSIRKKTVSKHENTVAQSLFVNDNDNITLPLTITAYIEPYSLQSNDAIVSKYDSGSELGFSFLINSDGNLYFYISSNGSSFEAIYNTDTPIMINNGYNVVVTVDDSGNGKLYINGKLVEEKNDFTITSLFENKNLPLKIGYVESNSFLFDGLIGDVRIYDCVLTDSEVEQLHRLDSTRPSLPKQLPTGSIPNNYLLYIPDGYTDVSRYQTPFSADSTVILGSDYVEGTVNNDDAPANCVTLDVSAGVKDLMDPNDNKWTFSFWVYDSGVGLTKYIIGNNSTWHVRISSTGIITWRSGGNKGPNWEEYDTREKWTHICFTYDGTIDSAPISLYGNGEHIRTVTYVDSGAVDNITYSSKPSWSTSNDFYILKSDDTQGNSFVGKFKNIKLIYDEVKTADWVKQEYLRTRVFI